MKTTWGDFEVDDEALLGRGGMGSVFKARQLSLDRLVAVKVLDTSRAANEDLEKGFFEKFQIEAKALAKLRDPRIISIIQAGQNDGRCWYAMELVDGETVDERLTRQGMFEEAASARIGAEVARALDAAFRQGITHRDVKPANIFLLKDGGVKLGDFGLARSPEFAPTRMTEINAVAATPTYASPEQGMAGDSDHRSDIYSLGVVLYEMLTERPPFGGSSSMETLFKHVNEEPPSMRTLRPSLSGSMEAVVMRCLEKEPAERYQTYGDLIEDLEAAASGRPVHNVDVEAEADVAKPSLVLWSSAVVGAIVVAFLVVTIWKTIPAAAAPATALKPPADPPKEFPKEIPREPAKEPVPEPPKEAPRELPRPPEPDPHAADRTAIEALCADGRFIDALERARAKGLPGPEVQARDEALRSLDAGALDPVKRYAALVGDDVLVREVESLAVDTDGALADAFRGTRGERRALKAVHDDARALATVALEGREVWEAEPATRRDLYWTFENKVLEIWDEKKGAWMSKALPGAGRGLELEFVLEPGKGAVAASFVLFLSAAGGQAGQAHGRTLVARADGTFSILRVDGTGTRTVATGARGAGRHLVEVVTRGAQVIVYVDGAALWHDAPPDAERPEGRVRLGVSEGKAIVSRLRVAK